ncbi:MAG: hypothetical protein RL497_1488 [Pseudomonadota bacterium]|jgi:hypothetical protein
MLPLSVGILSWRSNKSLKNSLESYKKNNLFDVVKDVKILFQQARPEDIKLAKKYGIDCIPLEDNIGIGSAFYMLAEKASEPNILLLEHDWELVENASFTLKHLEASISLIQNGANCVRLRHREHYGFPHYSIERYQGKELSFFDDWIQLHHPHLLDAIHWVKDPEVKWPDKIKIKDDFYVADSRYGNWTNNPCMYASEFYLSCVKNFTGEGIDLERNISYWWARQSFTVAQGQGLFKHNDIDKYQFALMKKISRKLMRLVK